MKYRSFCMIVLLWSFIAILFADNSFPRGEIAAEVNGETISQQAVVKVLDASYGEGAAESLNIKVIRAVLDEMIILKVIQQKMQNHDIRCTKQDYLDAVALYEQLFFDYYREWGLKNHVSFTQTLYKIIKQSRKQYNLHGKNLRKVLAAYPLKFEHLQLMENAWRAVLAHSKLKKYMRREVFRKHHVNYKVFKYKIRYITEFQKYVTGTITQQELDSFIQSEKFVLEGGKVHMSHILLLTVERRRNKNLSEKKQQQVLKKIQQLRTYVKPDASNFGKLASKYSEDEVTRYNKGVIGWVPRWTHVTIFSSFLLHLGWIPHWTAFTEDLVEQGYRMAEKQVSQVIKTNLGYHLIVINKRRKAKALPKEKLLSRGREKLALLKMERILRDWVKQSDIKRKI